MTRELQGWIEDPRSVEAFLSQSSTPVFAVSGSNLRGSGEGKIACLWKSVERVAGSYPVRLQTIGDCTSQGYAGAGDVVQAVEIDLHGERERWIAPMSSEPIYGLGRVDIGGGRLSGDGAVGAWLAKAVLQFGLIPRGKYGSTDLRRYSGQRAREWGRRGIPASLKPVIKEHPIRTASLVSTWEECRDAVANGHPVAMCSGMSFSRTRDRYGFAKRTREGWAHCMLINGIRDDGRPGACVQNSWGPDWISGPKGEFDIPDGAFWASAEDIDFGLRSWRDSFALSGYEGFPSQDLDYLLF